MIVVLKVFHNWRHIKIYVFSWQRNWQWEPFIYNAQGRVHNSNTRDGASGFKSPVDTMANIKNLGAKYTDFLNTLGTVISVVLDDKDKR